MIRSKTLFYLIIFVSICYSLPTSKNDSLVNKEVKINSVQEIKANATNVKPPQANNSNLKVSNFNETKIATQSEEKSKSNDNDNSKLVAMSNISEKDIQRILPSSQNGSQIIAESPFKKTEENEVKTEKLPEVNEKKNEEKDQVDGKTESQENEKEKHEIQTTEKESKENLNINQKLLDNAKKKEDEKQASENLSPVENVPSEKQSTFKQADKEEIKEEDTMKEISKTEEVAKEKSENEISIKEPLYNSEEIERKEENYEDEYDAPNSQVNIKNNPEKENPSINSPSGYIPNKNLGMIDDANSHFFAYLVTLMVLVVLFYLLFHNKQRIIALMIEGRGSRPSRRGSARAKYHKLDNNLEEAMGSMRTGGNANLNNIY